MGLTAVLRGELWDLQRPDVDIRFPVKDRPGVLAGPPEIGLIVSMNVYNQSALPTVMVALVVPGAAPMPPGSFVIPSDSTSGLAVASVADLSGLLTVDKTCLLRRRGRLDDAGVAQLNQGLRLILTQGEPPAPDQTP